PVVAPRQLSVTGPNLTKILGVTTTREKPGLLAVCVREVPRRRACAPSRSWVVWAFEIPFPLP
ncbi:MAG: hypothetical protein ACPG77_15680, partial [Nannocystaceae bacterium]